MIVVDTSLAAKWVIPEEHSELALSFLASLTGRGEQIVVPCLLLLEFTNVVHQRARRNVWSDIAAAEALDDLFQLDLEVHSPTTGEWRSLQARALALAREHDLPATYDASYLALAESLGCEMWTADERLVRRLADGVPYVRSLRSYTEDD